MNPNSTKVTTNGLLGAPLANNKGPKNSHVKDLITPSFTQLLQERIKIKPTESQLIHTLETSLASLDETETFGSNRRKQFKTKNEKKDYLHSILINKFENWLYPGLSKLNIDRCESCCVLDEDDENNNTNKPGNDLGSITIPKKNELVSLFYAPDSKSWPNWKMTVIGKGNGEINSVWDELIQSQVLRIVGNPKGLVYVTCPASPKESLHMKHPFLNLIVRNFNAYFSMELEILDNTNERRTFLMTNFRSLVRIKKNHCSMPMRLHRGWNLLLINLPSYVKDAFGTKYVETVRIKINSNIYLRRVYFAAKVFDEITLPAEYKIFPKDLFTDENGPVPKFRKRQQGEEEMILLEDMEVPPTTLILDYDGKNKGSTSKPSPIGSSSSSKIRKSRRLVEIGSTLIPVEDEEEWKILLESHSTKQPLSFGSKLLVTASNNHHHHHGHGPHKYDKGASQHSVRGHYRLGGSPTTAESSKDTGSTDSLKVLTVNTQNYFNDFGMGSRTFQRRSTVIYLNPQVPGADDPTARESVATFSVSTATINDAALDSPEKASSARPKKKNSLSSTHSCPSGNITKDLEPLPSFGCILNESTSASTSNTTIDSTATNPSTKSKVYNGKCIASGTGNNGTTDQTTAAVSTKVKPPPTQKRESKAMVPIKGQAQAAPIIRRSINKSRVQPEKTAFIVNYKIP